ncbi:BREX system P-loop protein BrxC [Parabacteroides sp.]
MQLKDLYIKPINRSVNPAVSATKFDKETIDIEIKEYVFTDEILNGLYRILNAIKNNKPYDHVGIWIDGYYGSGKSHFLKYLDYCITPETREAALERLLNAVKEIDPFDGKHNLQFELSQIQDIALWLRIATIDTCIFNLETSYNAATDKKKAFLQVFWDEFNGKRGLNKFNLTLAQLLEKPLMERGLLEQFKEAITEMGGDWNNPSEAADLVDQALEMVINTATELNPQFDRNSLYNHIDKRDYAISIERFGMELADYLKDKGEDYRLILLADEVSQFINKERDRYLNLQEIITKLSEACHNQVWVACTAQQDLSEIMDDCNIGEEKDKEGKIKGRFEVKVSLKGTQPEVITQKRILEKKPEVKTDLAAMYEQQQGAFSLQFKLPNAYKSYDTETDFIDFYPFVPYQFKLIMQVFDSFLALGYVAKEVKGNERSIIKVIHSTAKNNAQAEVGKFVSFDELYNNMFEEGLQARGQKAVDNAIRIARTYTDPKLAIRVANVLFMICNISQTDQLVFPATLDNITTLLINDMTTPRLNLKNEVEKVVDFLCENNIIRREQGRQGAPDFFSFYSEEEMKVAELIKSQTADNNLQAGELKEIFNRYLKGLKNKEQYKTRAFAVGMTINQRNYLNNNPDVVLEFMMDDDYDTPELLALQNQPNRLVYYVGPQFRANARLRNNFYWYCKVQSYMTTNPATSDENAAVREEFKKRAGEVMTGIIEREFQKILDTCPLVSGFSVIDDVELGNKKGNERYLAAIEKHLSSIYTKAGLVDSPQIPRNSDKLKAAILRPVNPGDYEGLNASLTEAEHEVEIYLNKQCEELNVGDVVAKFSKAPHGWDGICTLYVVNELVRRHKRDYSYSNNPNVEVNIVANRLLSETNKFTIRPAVAISPEVMNGFIAAWKNIFGVSESFTTTDSTQLFRLSREKENVRGIENVIARYRQLYKDNAAYSFSAPLDEMVTLLEGWLTERDPLKYFRRVIDEQQQARALFDTCKEVVQFAQDQMVNYKDVLRFVRDNRDNFGFVPTELHETVTQLLEIENATWPIAIRTYMRLRNILVGAIDAKRTELRKQISEEYSKTYAQLEQGCKDNEVPTSVLSDQEATVKLKTQSDSIPVLQTHLDTNAFFAEQMAKILAAKPKPVGPSKAVKQMALHTRTTQPLETEAEVEKYLDDLRKQLMSYIAKGEKVMIIK